MSTRDPGFRLSPRLPSRPSEVSRPADVVDRRVYILSKRVPSYTTTTNESWWPDSTLTGPFYPVPAGRTCPQTLVCLVETPTQTDEPGTDWTRICQRRPGQDTGVFVVYKSQPSPFQVRQTESVRETPTRGGDASGSCPLGCRRRSLTLRPPRPPPNKVGENRGAQGASSRGCRRFGGPTRVST